MYFYEQLCTNYFKVKVEFACRQSFDVLLFPLPMSSSNELSMNSGKKRENFTFFTSSGCISLIACLLTHVSGNKSLWSNGPVSVQVSLLPNHPILVLDFSNDLKDTKKVQHFAEGSKQRIQLHGFGGLYYKYFFCIYC